MTESGKYSVLFICLGNICRSPAAQAVMQAMVDDRGLTDRFYIDSAGIGGWHIGDLPDKRMRVHARPRGYELSHRARRVQSSDFDDFDLIVGMDRANMADLRRLLGPDGIAKCRKLLDFANIDRDVADPWYTDDFEATYSDVITGCEALLRNLPPR